MKIRCILYLFPILSLVCSQILEGKGPYTPYIAEKSTEGELATHQFKLPGGMTGELFAAEPMVANPVAFCFDELGRIYVAETFRQKNGVEDNREHMNWLLDDLSANSIEDRLAFFKKHLKEDVQKFAIEHDRIRLLEDTDGDGRADKSTVFADGFNAIEDGTGAGLLAINGQVFYTCIPKLWRLEDTNGDGIADSKQALYDGFGVRVAFRGHDMHGLIVGPDGRLYFSIGDRGYNVEIGNQSRLFQPDQGAVFRCELDGSNLEVFCSGLRNPQELAFDNFGNLFTGDNNSDSGDRARWAYLLEGSDAGWRMYYQYLEDRGPWNREKLWHLQHSGQPAYVVPPVAHFADGPSGLTHYPGTGLDERYVDHFFLADFRGQSSNSGIHSFSLIPKGASFELVNPEQFMWSILATDVDFGFDGGIYVSDWVNGWNGSGKGRIYRFVDQKQGRSPIVTEVSTLMKEGFDTRPPGELASLLAHPDYRIRQRAQFALVKKLAVTELVEAAHNGKTLFARVHAIWGIGQLARKDPGQLKPLLPLLDDMEPEIRVQLSRVCGDAGFSDASVSLIKLLKDTNPHVRSLAAIASGKLKEKSAVPRLLEALAENADTDAALRHALVMGLVGTATPEELIATARMPVAAIRIGAVVALSRTANPGLSVFLNDADPLVVSEAVRAIHDLRITEAMPAVAKLLANPGLSDPVLRRALSANYLLGAQENAEAVASFVGNPLCEDHLRLEGLLELHDWNSPGPLDRVTNQYFELPRRSADIGAVVRPWLGSIFAGSPKIQEAGIRLARQYGITEVEPFLVRILKESQNTIPSLRVASLIGLDGLKSGELGTLIEFALTDAEPAIRSEARRVLSRIDPVRAVKSLADASKSSSTAEQQEAVSSLAEMKRPDADAVLTDWLGMLVAGTVSPAIHLDLLNAAQARGTRELLGKIAAFNQSRAADDHLREYRETLFGGDVDRGREIFFGRSEASCRRCHKIDGSGGEVGPDLSRIGIDKKRDYLLESLVDPNKQIAKGFETMILQMSDGKVYAGIVKREDDQMIQLVQPDGRIIAIVKSEIEERAIGRSGMPEDLVKKLSKFEIRDLVEYLSTLKSPVDTSAHGEQAK